VVRSDERQRQYDLHELSVQVARVKEKTRPWKESIALVLAIGAAVVSHNAHWIFADVAKQTFSQLPTVIAYALAVVFCVLATIAVLGISSKTQNFLRPRLGSSHAAIVRYAIVLVGIIVTLVLTLQLCRVPVGQLVVGGALTSVLLGIAAQQSLSNIFAGMVLLLSRPFRVGDHIQLRAGALGGELTGTVTEIGITYIRLDIGDSVMSVPNSQVLAAAVGPVPPESADPEPEPPPEPEAENPVTRPPGTGAHV
jgi:small-conductance mechanosensitive channel